MPFARASELDRLLACVGSTVLPRLDTRSKSTKDSAEWGNQVHRWMESGIAESDALAERIALSGADRKKLWPGCAFELTMALNVVTGAVDSVQLTTKDARDEWTAAFGDEWITGTCDAAGELLDSSWVDDLKTGRFARWQDFEAQQSFYALAWTRFYRGGTEPCRSTITHWPRYPKQNSPAREGRVLSLDYLAGYAKRLNQLRDDVLKAKQHGPELTLGSHCTYCPSRENCPKFTKEKDD